MVFLYSRRNKGKIWIHINPFVPNAPFLYPMKTSENLTVSRARERVH